MTKSNSLTTAIFNFVYYRTFREWLPKRLALINGKYTVYGPRLLDPLDKDRIEGHELQLLQGIEQTVTEGDKVIIIGGGLGVSSLKAANAVGESGSVHTFEASEEVVEYLHKTISLNNHTDNITVTHSGVGPVISTWGKKGDMPSMDPTDLPYCDVLVLDCEGAEKNIVNKMEFKPRNIVVEYHKDLGVSETDIRKELKRANYLVDNHEVEIPDRGIGIFTTSHKGETN